MKVLKPFQDKTDGFKRYKKGDSYNHEDDKRIAFLVERGFIEKKTTKKKKKADVNE